MLFLIKLGKTMANMEVQVEVTLFFNVPDGRPCAFVES